MIPRSDKPHEFLPMAGEVPLYPPQVTENPENHSRPFIIPIFLPHAGCRHRCVFCNQFRITGETSSHPTPQDLESRIDHFCGFRRHPEKPVEIAFYGGNFLGLPAAECKSMLTTAEKFVASGCVNGIRFSTRPDTISEETCSVLQAFSISAVEIGVQSMDDRVLEKCHRGHSASDTVLAMDLLRKKGHRVGLQLMVGLPGEDAISRQKTAERVCRLSPDFVRIYPTLVMPESELANQYHAGSYSPLSLQAAVQAVKKLYTQFEKNRIPVIRMGLQSTPFLEKKNAVVSGPYHPAFGHMVFSEIEYDKITAMLETAPPPGDVLNLRVHPSRISRVQGLKKENLRRLQQQYGFREVRILTDPAAKNTEIRYPTNSNKTRSTKQGFESRRPAVTIRN